jgi:hypothetical protein
MNGSLLIYFVHAQATPDDKIELSAYIAFLEYKLPLAIEARVKLFSYQFFLILV